MKYGRRHRYPEVFQITQSDCAIACVKSIMRYLKRPYDSGDLSYNLGNARDGASLADIKNVLTEHGVSCSVYKMSADGFLDENSPGLLHWGPAHFVLFEGARPGKIQIFNPAIGRQVLTKEEFEEKYRGVVLRHSHVKGSYVEAWHTKWIKYSRNVLSIDGIGSFIGVLFASSLIGGVFGLLPPLATKLIIDTAIPNESTELLQITLLLFIGLTSLQILNNIIGGNVSSLIKLKIDIKVTHQLVRSLLNKKYSELSGIRVGDMVMRVNATALVRDLVVGQVVPSVINLVKIALYLAVVYLLSPMIALLVAGVSLAQLSILALSNKAIYRLSREEIKKKSSSQSKLVDVLKTLLLSKASGGETESYNQWREEFGISQNGVLQRYSFLTLVSAVTQVVRANTPIVIIVIGASNVISGNMTIGDVIAASSLASSVLGPLSSIVTTVQQVQLVGGHLERMDEIAHLKSEEVDNVQNHDTHLELGGRALGLRYQNVSFSYSKTSPKILDKVSFELPAGQMMAIVGPSGIGKTTLVQLLTSIYEPTSGIIEVQDIDGKRPLGVMDRKRIGYVMQDPKVFPGSILQNLTMSRPGVDDEQVKNACEMACIRSEIESWPLKYQTVLGENSTGISGGQLQRMAIARALLRNPSLLILDEATSNIDEETERRIFRNMKKLPTTVIFISHRASVLENADQIFEL